MGGRFIPHARLDKYLEVFARRPERFTGRAVGLCGALDARGCDLEISDPIAWRDSGASRNVSVEKQFTAEIDSVRTMEREEELRLALRIEFAGLRLRRASEQHGLGVQDLTHATALDTTLSRRKREWHALRLEMVERNLYLVLLNVGRYKHTSADRADLIQAAASTLLRAVDGFDWRRGVRFRTYAVHWLNQGFRNHLYNHNRTIRLPVNLQKTFKRVNAAVQRLNAPHASVEEIAREASLSTRVIASVNSAMMQAIRSLDDCEGTRTLASELPLQAEGDPSNIALEEVSIESGVQAALGRLTDRQRRVVKLRFGIDCVRGHTHSEIARELGVSMERIRQILGRAMFVMRASPLRKLLEPLVT